MNNLLASAVVAQAGVTPDQGAGGFRTTGGGTSGAAGSGNGGITNPVLESLGNQSGASFFGKFIPSLIGIGLLIGVLYFVYYLIWGSIKWISSGGDKQSLESARGTITNAILGIVILFAVFALIQLVETFFGFNILTLDIGPLVIQ